MQITEPHNSYICILRQNLLDGKVKIRDITLLSIRYFGEIIDEKVILSPQDFLEGN